MGIRKKGVTADNWPVRLHSVKTRGQSAARNLTLLLAISPCCSLRIHGDGNRGRMLEQFFVHSIFVARILFYFVFRER